MHAASTPASATHKITDYKLAAAGLNNTALKDQAIMKAVICTRYGAPKYLKIIDRLIPVPAADEVLIKVHAASVTAADTMMRRGKPKFSRLFLGLRRPKAQTPGTGFAGIVISVGSDVTKFACGDRVFGETGLKFSAHAEYVCLKADALLINTPTVLSACEAACICDGALTSYNFLIELGQLKPSDRVLIIGASGSLGTAAVQLAKHFGASVTAVCSAKNSALVRALGADHVIDYTTRDFHTQSNSYDLIYDCIGKSSYRQSKQALTKNGRYLSPVLNVSLLLSVLSSKLFGSKRALFSATGIKALPELKHMLAELIPLYMAGDLSTVIDRRYRIEQTVEANRYVDTERKRGNVVLMMHD